MVGVAVGGCGAEAGKEASPHCQPFSPLAGLELGNGTGWSGWRGECVAGEGSGVVVYREPAYGSPLTLFTFNFRVGLANEKEVAQSYWFRTKLVFLQFPLRLLGIFIIYLILTASSESSLP